MAEVNYKTIQDVQELLDSIPNINCGGCGVSALAMYRWLKKTNKHNGTKFVFLYQSYEQDLYLNNESVLRNGTGNPKAPSHACILHEGEFLDSTGRVNVGEFKWVQIIDEETFIKHTIDNVDSWNHMFNREKFLPNIEEELGIDLSDIRQQSVHIVTKEVNKDERI